MLIIFQIFLYDTIWFTGYSGMHDASIPMHTHFSKLANAVNLHNFWWLIYKIKMLQYVYMYYFHGNKKKIAAVLQYADLAIFGLTIVASYKVFGNETNRIQADQYLSPFGQTVLLRCTQVLLFVGALSYGAMMNDTKFLCLTSFKVTCPEKQGIVAEKLTSIANNLINSVSESFIGTDLNVFEKEGEIIYFSSVLLKISGNIVETVSDFQTYVKPMHKPVLTVACMEKTGITQLQVDNGVTFPKAIEMHETWLKKQAVPPTNDKSKDLKAYEDKVREHYYKWIIVSFYVL